MQARYLSELQHNVAGVFQTPGDIAGHPGLEKPQKIALLKQWEEDLRELLVASEENMLDGAARPGQTAELLRGVRRALIALAGEYAVPGKDVGGAPTKAGGRPS